MHHYAGLDVFLEDDRVCVVAHASKTKPDHAVRMVKRGPSQEPRATLAGMSGPVRKNHKQELDWIGFGLG